MINRHLTHAHYLRVMETTLWKDIIPTQFNMSMDGRWISNWFSNLCVAPITIDGFTWASTENYYQAMKCLDTSHYAEYASMSPRDAKNKGRKIPLRPDWEEVKESVMEKALCVKFATFPWCDLLLETGDEIIVEWNNWGDTYWGVDSRSCQGFNKLGYLLMKIRDNLNKETEFK